MSSFMKTMLALSVCAASLMAAEGADAPKPKPYTLDTCPVSGDKLGTMGDAIVVVRDGHEIKFCCKGCIKDFDKDPAAFLKKIDAAEQAKTAEKAKAPAKTAAPSAPCCP